jgi:hypothetical protein
MIASFYIHDDLPPVPPTKKPLSMAVVISVIAASNIVIAVLAFIVGIKITSSNPNTDEKKEVLSTSTSGTPTQTFVLSPTVSTTVSPTPKSKSILTQAETSLSGYVVSSSASSVIKKDILVGQTEDGIARGFLTFDIDNVPSSAKVVSAMLSLNQTSVNRSPFSNLGKLYIDHLTYGTTLDTSDYALPALLGNVATVPPTESLGKKEIDVTAAVANDISNARGRSQFRIHFEKENKSKSEQLSYVLYSLGLVTQSTGAPTLFVVYTLQ